MAKSRITLVLLSVMALPAAAEQSPLLARYEALTAVSPRCSAPQPGREILVCGRRRADRWRVPYLLKEAGDPSIQDVWDERNALLPTRTPCQDHSIFLVGCGKGVGFSATLGLGPGVNPVRVRPLAD